MQARGFNDRTLVAVFFVVWSVTESAKFVEIVKERERGVEEERPGEIVHKNHCV